MDPTIHAATPSVSTPRRWGYWTVTALALFFMMSGGAMMLFTSENVDGIVKLGYPAYLCNILGLAKLLGGIAILQRRSRTLAEWAYAGFTFDLVGAAASHLIVGEPIWKLAAPGSVLALVLASYYLWKRQPAGA